MNLHIFYKGEVKLTKQNNSKLYKQWWFWGVIILFIGIVYIVMNTEQLTSETFSGDNEIHPYTREIGSGTRTAFTEVTGLTNDEGDDIISATATVQNSTNAIMQTVASDPHGVSYISLGSLNDSVKALAVDGIEPTSENIQSDEYQLYRNFNVTYGQELSEVAEDFWNFMFSAQAQVLVEETGFIPVDSNAPEYVSSDLSGSVTVVGSTSVEPVIQRFAEEYVKYNPNVRIDITAPGSGAGITTAIDGSSDIGMSSREVSEDEAAQLIETRPIAIDGIVMIVNKQNEVDDIDYEDIRKIYLADYELPNVWNDIINKIN